MSKRGSKRNFSYRHFDFSTLTRQPSDKSCNRSHSSNKPRKSSLVTRLAS